MSTISATRNSDHRVEVASNTPGRLRVRLHRNGRQSNVMKRIKEHLEAQDGISGVSLNPGTGSVKVDYDCEQHSAADIFKLLEDVDVIAESLMDAPHVDGQNGASSSFSDAIEDLDNRVSRITGINIDLGDLLPLSFAGVGLWSIARNGLMIESVPGWLFLWFAFDTFIKLHPEAAPR